MAIPSGTVREQRHFKRPCSACGALAFLGDEGLCFACGRDKNGQRFSFYASVSAEGEDSSDPRRVADGSASFNLGLPGVETDCGRRPNGTRAVDYRPITNNELPTKCAREDYAKSHGLVPVGTAKRAIGGRT